MYSKKQTIDRFAHASRKNNIKTWSKDNDVLEELNFAGRQPTERETRLRFCQIKMSF